MSDFPAVSGLHPFGCLSTADPTCCPYGEFMLCTNSGPTSAATWPLANLAIYVPVVVEAPCTAYQMGITVSTQSGNVDVGIYNESGTKLVSSGSTAVAAAGFQAFNITDTPIPAGVIFLAMACDNTTASFNRNAPTLAGIGRTFGLLEQTSAFALPSTMTGATYTRTYVPLLAASTVATI